MRAERCRPTSARLLAIEAIKQRDWKAALIETGKIEQDRGFAFLAPYLRAWIAVGSRQGDPLAMIETARSWPIGAPYVGEQRALVLVALGRTEEGVAAFRALDTHGIGSRPAQLRLLFADALAKTGQKQRALDLIDGERSGGWRRRGRGSRPDVGCRRRSMGRWRESPRCCCVSRSISIGSGSRRSR